MERQQLYRANVVARPGGVRGSGVIAAPGARVWTQELLAAVGAAGQEALAFAAREHARDGETLAAEALLEADAEFAEWKDAWTRENQGGDALEARRAFAEKHAAIAVGALRKFGREGETSRDRLLAGLRLRSLRALEEGAFYEARQREAWEKSVFEGEKAAFQKLVEENPQDSDLLLMRGRELHASWLSKNPGLDGRAVAQNIQAMISKGRVRSLLARRDFGSAKRLLEDESLPGLGELERRGYESRAESGLLALRKAERADYLLGEGERLASAALNLPLERREHALKEAASEIADPQEREAVLQIASQRAAQAARLEKGAKAAMAYDFMETARKEGWSGAELEARLDVAEMGEEAKKLVLRDIRGQLAENEATENAFSDLLAGIDESGRNGGKLDENDVCAFALENGLGLVQTRRALDYLAAGSLHGLKMERLREVYDDLQDAQDEKTAMPGWLFPAVAEELGRRSEAGKRPDDDALRRIAASLLIRRAARNRSAKGGETPRPALQTAEKEESHVY